VTDLSGYEKGYILTVGDHLFKKYSDLIKTIPYEPMTRRINDTFSHDRRVGACGCVRRYAKKEHRIFKNFRFVKNFLMKNYDAPLGVFA
jgi:hypothetical protein